MSLLISASDKPPMSSSSKKKKHVTEEQIRYLLKCRHSPKAEPLLRDLVDARSEKACVTQYLKEICPFTVGVSEKPAEVVRLHTSDDYDVFCRKIKSVFDLKSDNPQAKLHIEEGVVHILNGDNFSHHFKIVKSMSDEAMKKADGCEADDRYPVIIIRTT